MKRLEKVMAVIVFTFMVLGVTEMAFARSASLTTTIVITVKAPPKNNIVTASEKNIEIMNQLASNQSMINPSIKEMERMTEDIKFSGEKVYTIIDML